MSFYGNGCGGSIRDTTIEHIVHPQNTQDIPNPDGYAATQSSCNEIMKIWLRVRNDIVVDSGFWTNGCAATIACGSMGTELVKDKSIREALANDGRGYRPGARGFA